MWFLNVYLSPVCWIPFCLVYSSFPVFLLVIPGVSTLPCLPLMLSLKTIILKYFLVCVFLVSPCCVHRDRRPDQTVSVVPSPRFVLFVFSSLWFVPVFCPFEPSCPPFAGVYAAVRGSLRRRSRLSHPAVRGTSCRRSRLSDPAVRGSWRRRSRLCHPAVRGSSRRRSRIYRPSVPRGWRLHPRLTLARRPASDSMPAGLPLTQCPPACLWFQLARSAADSSSPDCRWLKLAGLPLTHATGRRQGRPTHHLIVSRRRPRPTCVSRAASTRESQPAVRGSLGPQPVEAPSSPPAPAVVWSARRLLPLFVKPADYGIPRRPLPYWQASRPWPYLTRQWPRSF